MQRTGKVPEKFHFSDFFNSLQLNPPLFLLLGFAGLILTGAILLSLPWVTQQGTSPSSFRPPSFSP